MKKNAVGFIAIVAAIGCFAFTSNTKSDRFACNDTDLIWYTLAPGSGGSLSGLTIGSTIGSLNLSFLNQNLYTDLTPGVPFPANVPNGTLEAADFSDAGIYNRIRLESEEKSLECPGANDFQCAVAFRRPASFPSSEFTITGGFVVPTTSAIIQCVVFRPTQP